MNNVLSAMLGLRWAILPEALEQMFAVVNRDFSPEDLSKAIHGGDWERFIQQGEFKPEAVEAVQGERLPGTKDVTVREGVAVIPIIGPIFPRANLFTELSGGVSINQLSLDYNAALESDSVHTILFNIDSPGGEITGTSEFANMIFSGRNTIDTKRKERKCVISYASGSMASGAYWIGSAADEIFVNSVSAVGSIGVVAGFTDRTKMDEKRGLKRVEIVSSQSPNKRADPEQEEGRAEIQRVVDELASVFVAEVAEHRGVDSQHVLTRFGRGGLVIGRKAIEAEMADSFGSLEEIIQIAVEQNGNTQNHFLGGSMNVSKQEPEVTMSYEAVRESAPEVFEKIRLEGIEEGKKGERERIQAIESIQAPGYEALIAEHKFKPESTKESVAAMVLEAQEARRQKAQQDHEADGAEAAEQASNVHSGEAEEAEREQVTTAMVGGANAKIQKR